jgi:hypothetical protein
MYGMIYSLAGEKNDNFAPFCHEDCPLWNNQPQCSQQHNFVIKPTQCPTAGVREITTRQTQVEFKLGE